MYAYCVKFKSISKNEALLEMDDNVWNDKDTDDFLHYLKFEYFLISYVLTYLFMEIVLGFSDAYSLGSLGPRDFEPIGLIFLLLIASRALSLLLLF
mmetsp:Transcript_11641/g.17665  ORF Transcript_11641/g.17665 Transcript_11641/m.17665 type:complete len:96 (-) Transcript_11641:540-827(-)